MLLVLWRVGGDDRPACASASGSFGALPLNLANQSFSPPITAHSV